MVKSKKGKASSPRRVEKESFEVVPTEPLKPAWDDLVDVSCGGKSHRLQVASLHTGLQAVTRVAEDDNADEAGGKSVFVSLPQYEPPNVQPGLGGDDFQLASQCLMHLATPDEGQEGTATDNVCLFLYEVCSGDECVATPG